MKVVATTRSAQGSSASRRLRRSGKVPGIIYGSTGAQPTPVEIDHNPLYHSLRVEAFHSSILDMEIDGRSEKVLLRDVQWHAYKPQVMHIDFQRVAADQKIHVKVPLHYVNQENSPAVKLSAAIVSHVLTEIDVSCLPGNLPEFITVDLADLTPGKPLHLSDVTFPEGVSPVNVKENPVLVVATVKGGGGDAEEPAAAAPAPAPAAAKAPAKK
ncbi:MAG TPA: 50S ribosomal protein L25/general stress protein Ctc [Burkholderiaceae bacterium]|nr:50S ribosomal protein L25/general stress protein Ctc [Burkholderiaceae bacterium]